MSVNVRMSVDKHGNISGASFLPPFLMVIQGIWEVTVRSLDESVPSDLKSISFAVPKGGSRFSPLTGWGFRLDKVTVKGNY